MRKIHLFLAVLGLACLSGQAALFAATVNLIKNADFENAIGGSDNWDNTANRGLSRVTAGAPSGSAFLRLDEATTVAGGFAGVFTFQVVSPASPGDIVAFSGLVRANALDGGDAGQLRIEFQTAAGVDVGGAVNVSAAAVSASFSRIAVSSAAPAGTGRVVFVIRIQPSNAGGGSQVDFDDVIGTISSAPIALNAFPGSTTLQPGQLKMIAIHVQNTTTDALAAVELRTDSTPGINIKADAAKLDGNKVGNAPGSVIFQLGNLAAGQERVLSFPIVLTSGIVPGKNYEITISARASTGQTSALIHIKIRTQLDPLFDEGTLIGKVFNDTNQNGVQDKGEHGVPWVRLMTEEGIEIVTDEEGRYHIPAVKPGRHLVKIDGHSLPEGTKFITEESYLVKTTPGILNKANFAVLIPPSKIPAQFQKELMVMITQGLDTTQPDLGVTMEPDLLKVGIGVLERNPVFKFSTNYPEMVKSWYLEIRDEMGREVWTGFGVAAPPPDVIWGGQMEAGLLIRPGLYSYQFKVEDKEGHQDWTPLSFFRVISKADNSEQANRLIEIPPIGNFNLMKDGRRSIPLIAKPTIRIAGKTKLKNKIEINSRPVPVDPENGMFQTEFYTTAGEKDFVVTATTPEGESTRFHQTVKVKDSTFFMVALSEEQMGFNFDRGNIETSGQETTYKDGFYQDGRLSYALRGKLKGKFLIKSHYDTSDKRNALFTNLNPDDYYPIYGDASTRNYEMRDTRERFYMVVEWDRSHIKYGSFKTAFSDTELATYNRTLSGLKMNYESQASTPYGDSKRGVKAFAAESTTHLGDHNEFAATGGSLYYLRNRNVIQGSEKLRVEVRDKIQNMTLNSRDLVEGQDYEINDADGRIMLSRPLSSVAASDTLTSNDIMDGSPVVLIADYEYDAGADAFGVADRGFRGFLQMGDHIRVGATAVEEKRQNTDYDLRGLDMTMKFGRNTKITAEYAETINKQTDQAISYNGGLSFADLDLIKGENTAPRENAYLIKGETKPVKNMELSGYLQGIDPTFSTERSPSQEGTRKYGMSARYKFTDTFAFRYRYDMNDIAKQLMPLSGNNLTASYESYNTHTAQLVYDDGKWLGEAEYRNLNTNIPDFNQRLSSPLSEFSFQHGITGKLGYHLNDRMLPYVKVQTAINGKSNNQFGGGVRYQVTKNLFAFIEEMVGAAGDSTYFGFEQSRVRCTREWMGLPIFWGMTDEWEITGIFKERLSAAVSMRTVRGPLILLPSLVWRRITPPMLFPARWVTRTVKNCGPGLRLSFGGTRTCRIWSNG